MKISGRISMYIDGKLIAEDNAIHIDLRGYLRESLTSTTDKSLSNFFTTAGPQDVSHEGQDGIILRGASDTYVMSSQHEVVLTNTTKRWKGLFSFPSTLGIGQAQLGKGLKPLSNTDVERFTTMYATKAYPTSIVLQPNQPLLIIWEIQIGRA